MSDAIKTTQGDPLLYETIIKQRLGAAIEESARALVPPRFTVERQLWKLATDAYAAGVADGFAQGVAAEVARATNTSGHAA